MSFSTMTLARPTVGVGVLVIQEGKILLGKRMSSNGEGSFAPPGGHLEMYETIEECTARELQEETNLTPIAIKEGTWANNIQPDCHYISLFSIVDEFSGTLENKEPDKCEAWDWFDIYQLPSPLYTPLQNLVASGQFHQLIAKHILSKSVGYLASPYAHPDPMVKKERLEKVNDVAASLFDQGIFVFSPLTHNVSIDALTKGSGWDKWRTYDLTMVQQCGKIYLLKQPGWEESVGVQAELEFAKAHHIPIEEIEC